METTPQDDFPELSSQGSLTINLSVMNSEQFLIPVALTFDANKLCENRSICETTLKGSSNIYN